MQRFLLDQIQIVIDGIALEPSAVLPGIRQGIVLGPIMFLVFINDLPEYVQSSTKLFDDDLILNCKVSSDKDGKILQDDLKNITSQEDKWGMKFHPDNLWRG